MLPKLFQVMKEVIANQMEILENIIKEKEEEKEEKEKESGRQRSRKRYAYNNLLWSYRMRPIKRTVRVQVGKFFCSRGFVKHLYNRNPQ